MSSGGALVLNIFFPGIGTLALGRTKEGIIQLVLYWFGFLLCFTIILSIIGIPMMLGAWIWGLVLASSSNNSAVMAQGAPQIVVNQHVGDAYAPKRAAEPEATMITPVADEVARAGPVFRLRGRAGNGTVDFRISKRQGTKIVGRAENGADFILDDPSVSRRHAQIEVRSDALYLSDLGSSNGTFVNGRKIGREAVKIAASDDIEIGSIRLSVATA